MKKQGKFTGAIALTLAIGGVLIIGNAALATRMVAEGVKAKSQTTISKANPETAEQDIVLNGNTNTNEVYSVIKTLPNGTTAIVKYSYGENRAQATVTYTNDGAVYSYEGEEAEATIERFGGTRRNLPNPYIEGQPDDGDIEQEAAISIATKSIIEKYALKQTVLTRFSITATYYSTYDDISGAVWFIDLYPINASDFSEIGCYAAVLNAETGEVVQLLSAADGKG